MRDLSVRDCGIDAEDFAQQLLVHDRSGWPPIVDGTVLESYEIIRESRCLLEVVQDDTDGHIPLAVERPDDLHHPELVVEVADGSVEIPHADAETMAGYLKAEDQAIGMKKTGGWPYDFE